ncbi:hypothetical protein CCACVL1_10378 [Corchorus capsularis]|uniref:F-box domain-containing protein n=1 Tax=Corchorus capsularis TaxID=210143 RepID=A0A1R3IRF8_COCAP|nr:hypothetical protein CCACVL1_10378 [Corchorus capsularis]
MGQRKLKLINKLKNREEQRTLPELPDHIILEILSKIPPEFLQDTFRFVCKAWYRLIRSFEFIEKNAVHHKPGIIVNFLVAPNYYIEFPYCKAKFLQIDEKDQFDIKLTNFGPSTRMGYIRSSCNGLILITEPRARKSSVLCVKNMLTRSVLTLPSCPSGCKHSVEECGIGLGFNPVTKEYKVVHIYSDGYGFEIFTIGSDKEWRKIPGPFEESYERPYEMEYFKWEDPVIINGHVFHWFVDSDEYFISMDIRDEKLRKTKLPELMMGNDYGFVEMAGKLSFVYTVSSSQIDVWVLTDFGKQKDKLPDFLNLIAVATLRNGEVIVLMKERNKGHNDPIYLYDMKNGEMRKLKMKMKDGTRFIPHRSSLPPESLPHGAINMDQPQFPSSPIRQAQPPRVGANHVTAVGLVSDGKSNTLANPFALPIRPKLFQPKINPFDVSLSFPLLQQNNHLPSSPE